VTDGLVKYGILPLIFPRKNFQLVKVLNGVIPPLGFYLDKQDRIQEYHLFLKKLVREFKEVISNWKSFKTTILSRRHSKYAFLKRDEIDLLQIVSFILELLHQIWMLAAPLFIYSLEFLIPNEFNHSGLSTNR
jgi:hypothetical protein